jgi:hypothetical protein
VVLGTAVTVLAVTLLAFGGIGVLLLSLILAHGVVTPFGTALLSVSLVGFVAAAGFGGWTLVEVMRGQVDLANQRRRAGTWALLAAVAVWLLAAAVS